jgi:hypothetical protein
MIKTQIQLPDELYREIKRVAREREMSLAEVLRRGAEHMTQVYPPLDNPKEEWTLPGPFSLGTKGDPFADPDWRFNLNSRGTVESVLREKQPARDGPGKKSKR